MEKHIITNIYDTHRPWKDINQNVTQLCSVSVHIGSNVLLTIKNIAWFFLNSNFMESNLTIFLKTNNSSS